MSSDSGVIRRAKRLIKGTAYMSTTEYEKFPDREQQGLGVRQDAEQVSRSSVCSFSITIVLNRTELAGQPSRFGQITHVVSVCGSLAGRAPADQTLSLTDCRLSATVAISSRLAEKPRHADGLD